MIYTRDDIMQMPPDALRLAIAEAKCHVKQYGDRYSIAWNDTNESVTLNARTEEEAWQNVINDEKSDLPNWSGQIVAAYVLENELPTDRDRNQYANYLIWIIMRIEPLAPVPPYALIHATAEQRCCAWLMWKYCV